VYLGSAELAAICSRLGRIPTREEYMAEIEVVNQQGAEIYRYMNFDQISEYRDAVSKVA
jgi:aconitate hydratase 2/2-methylisocitrate dehydratase